jgi:hypothetical protein
VNFCILYLLYSWPPKVLSELDISDHMESHNSCLFITYSAEIIDGLPLYVSSNCLHVKALKYEPAGHSFHVVASKLLGLGEKEGTN